MAQETYLELVTDVIVETGLNSGTPPSSVTSAEGDAAKVVYWVRVADLQIQRERIDFDFLWENPTVPLAQSSNIVPMPEDTYDAANANTTTNLINAIAKDRLAIINANGEAYFPTYMKWNEFSILYGYETQIETDFPAFWTMRPDRTLLLSEPVSSGDLTCKYEYWRKPIRMRENNDVSRIPDDFSRLIVLLAKILYAEHEDAPEVDMGSSTHYDVVFNQMLSVHAPEAEWQRMENNDVHLVVETR
jgi:hypothetical protein